MLIDDASAVLLPIKAYGARYWRKRAMMTRNKAKAADDERMQLRLLSVAKEYDRLAGYADASRVAE